MAFTSTIKPYKFVNPSSIKSKGGGATIIAGGKTITGGATSQVKSARVTMLAINRIGMAMEGLGKTQQQIRDIIVYENKYLAQTTTFRKKREGYKKDQKAEDVSESFNKKQQEDVSKEVQKKEKKSLGWLEKIFGPFAGIISFVGRFVISQTILRWMGDGKNQDKLVVFVKSFSTVFKWAFNIAYKSTDAVLTGFAKVFGSSDKKGLDRFGEVLGGLGQLLIGIAGFKALGYLLNPFSLVNDIIGLIDLLSARGGGGGGGATPAGGGGSAKPQLGRGAQKVAENYGDDAARYYDDLIKSGKKPGDALNKVRGKFKKIPPKPKGLLTQIGDNFTNLKKGVTSNLSNLKKSVTGGLSKAFANFKKFGSNITKGARDKLIKSGEFIKSSTQKAMQPIAKAAYDFLEKKGVIKLANNLGEKAVGTIQKIPGYSKIMAKVQKEGGQEVLKKLGGKAIPVIGGLVNLYFAYDRLKNGDKSGAALEALSAILDIAGLFTGGATSALSMVLDTYLFGRDFFPDLVKKENEAFGGLINNILSPIKGIKDSLPKLPWMAEGGIVDRPTIAGLGENGPEAVIPLSKLGGSGAMASTIIGATESALSRMGAAGEIAKSLIGSDLASAANLFGVSKVAGGGGDTLGKTVNKGGKGEFEIDAGDNSGISLFIGDKTVRITDKKNPANNPLTLRGQLANILGALIWVSKKNLSGGGGGGGAPSPSRRGGGDTSGDFTGSANAEKAFNYLKSKGLTPEQAAGLVGNFMQEAGVNINPKITNSIGHKGIAQWDPRDRWPKLVNFAKSKNLNPETLEAQLQFVWHELDTGDGGLSLRTLKSAKTVQQAAHLFVKQYERSGEDPGDPGYDNRITYGNQVYSKYAKMAKGGLLTNPRPGNGPLSENKMILKEEMNTSKFAKGGKIFLHWTASGYEFKQPGHYHSVIQGDGTVARLHDYNDRSVSHTYKRNGTGVGLSIAAMGGNPDPWSMPPKPIQITNMAKEIANIAKSWKWKPSDINLQNVMTHAEAASLKDGYTGHDNYGPKGWGGTGERWDLWQLKKGEANGSGGNKLRAMARGFMGGDSTVKDESGAPTTINPSDSNTIRPSDSTPEEPQKNPFQVLEEAINRLNSTLGYTTTTQGTKPSTTEIAFGKNTPQLAATGSSAAAAKGVNNMSTAVKAMKEASEEAGAPSVIPLPINTSVNTAAAFAAPQVIYPRTPITFSI